MAGVECRDIFDAVYIYTRGSYITNFFSSKVKSKSSSENISEDESSSKTKNDATQLESNTGSKETVGAISETVRESLDRTDESEVADKIRMDIDEKFPFALASFCSNLAVLDREYRLLKGYDAQHVFSEYIIETTDEFPLCDRFVFPAIMYVSSIILMDVDEKMSDEFYDKYASSVSKIVSELQFCLILPSSSKLFSLKGTNS